ncbi:MAG: hypothetical protein H6Q54_500 [Deltaproteobacteria bacterium]|jgi:hypothetical protein|nr:hypothetical protein [Deltaproteobacteria bacterium]
MTELLRFRINVPKVIHETIEGETVLVNLDSGNYYSLDGVGADVWGLLEQGAHVGGIIEWIADRYKGERTDIEKALCQLIEELKREELIVPDETRGSGNVVDRDGLSKVSPGLHTAMFVPPALNKYTDMQDLLLLDPIHDVDETGWPSTKADSPISEK